MIRFALAGLLCLGTAALAQDVRFDYDRSANFAAYRTFQWAEAPTGVPNQLTDQNIRRAIEAQLMLKGLQRVEAGGDLQIGYQVAREQEKEFTGFGTGPRFYGTGRVTTSTIDIGRLVLNMYDPVRRQLVWSGAATKTLSLSKDPDKNQEALQKAMAKLLKNYPPGSKK